MEEKGKENIIWTREEKNICYCDVNKANNGAEVALTYADIM